MSYSLPVKRCFNLDDHAEHSWECRGVVHKCPGMPLKERLKPLNIVDDRDKDYDGVLENKV